ncbi:HU family DNA-binding protein [Parabacteroides faecis]|uniref:HU family DNA-binding protein n=1 Tax=Parabacteroides TaxID=375288 RepID=UPI000EFF1FC5|nr:MULTISPECIES: HU family DNA-binding protein [Parabacteroides]MBC8620323.1 HU family DNA-binding protein [Parabacteroides faecis]RHR96665.1 HU family DNA-binding protein [Parabacteroides sp. AF14-59]
MNKANLVSKLAAKMHITQCQSREFLNSFQDVLTEAMKQDSPVMLQGFGTFAPWVQKERSGRNPRTGISCAIPARTSVKFKPGKFLLKELNT